MKEIVEATSRNRRNIGDGSASRHGRREVAAGRFLTSNGQSNAVNSPASSVQNLSASSQLVQQSEKKKRTNFKTVRDHQIFHGTADPRNSSLRKQAERDHTDQVRNQYLQAYQSLSPDLLARCIQCPIAISDDSLVREPSLLTHEMCDLHNRFITFAYAKCIEVLSNQIYAPPLVETLLPEFNELQPNSTTNMILKRSDFYSVSSLDEIWNAAKTQSTVHKLTVQEGHACKTCHSKDADDKLKRCITSSVKYILSNTQSSILPTVKDICHE